MPTITSRGRKPRIGFDAGCCDCSKKLKSIIFHSPATVSILTFCTDLFRGIATEDETDFSFYLDAADAVQISAKSPKQYSLPDLAHSVKVVLQIVQGGDRRKQDFAGLEQVPEEAARIGAAGGTAAGECPAR